MVGFEHQQKCEKDLKNKLDGEANLPKYPIPAFIYPNLENSSLMTANQENFRNWKKDICCWFQNPFSSIIMACCCPVILEYKIASKKSMHALAKIFIALFILQMILIIGMFAIYSISSEMSHHNKSRHLKNNDNDKSHKFNEDGRHRRDRRFPDDHDSEESKDISNDDDDDDDYGRDQPSEYGSQSEGRRRGNRRRGNGRHRPHRDRDFEDDEEDRRGGNRRHDPRNHKRGEDEHNELDENIMYDYDIYDYKYTEYDNHKHIAFILHKVGNCFLLAFGLLIFIRCIFHTYLRMKVSVFKSKYSLVVLMQMIDLAIKTNNA